MVGQRVMSGDPWAVGELAQRLRDVAQDISLVRTRFRGGHAEGLWTGDAANEFAQTLSELPAELDKISTSYVAAGDALSRYSHALREAQDAGRRLAPAASDAEDRRSSATYDRTYWQSVLKTAKTQRAAATDPTLFPALDRKVATAKANMDNAARRVGEADGEVGRADGQARDALHTFHEETRRCVEAMHHASELGVKNDVWSFLDRRSDIPILGLVIEPFASLAALIKDPGSITAWRDALSGIGDILAVVAIALIVVGTGGVALAVVAGAALVASVAVLALDSVRAAKGEVGLQQLAIDGVLVALSAVGMKATATGAVKAVQLAGKTTSKAWAKRYIKYGTTGRHMPVPKRVHDAAEEVRDFVVDKVLNNPRPARPLCAPAPAVSPILLIRHTRPLKLRSEALA
jgi:hypothetical protein